MATSSAVGIKGVQGTGKVQPLLMVTTNGNPSDSIKAENTRLHAENAGLKAKLTLSKQRVEELEAQINEEKAKLDNKTANDFGQEASTETETEQDQTIRLLKNLVAQNMREKMEVEMELQKLKESLKRKNDVRGFGESSKRAGLQQNLLLFKKEFDDCREHVKDLLESEDQELYGLIIQLRQTNQRKQSFIRHFNLQRLAQLLEPIERDVANLETNDLVPIQSVEVEAKAGPVPGPTIKHSRVDKKGMEHAKKPRKGEQ